MRRLYILRHAKSDWPQNMEDRKRPLAESGKIHALALAQKMERENYRPDIVLCSPARRTKETAKIVCANSKIDYDEQLYLASTGDLYEILKNIDNKYESAMVIGHNPGLHGLVQLLVGEGDPELISKILGGYTTGCLSVIECDCAIWGDLLPAGNRLADLVIGKELT